MGDPAGSGPEIVTKAVAEQAIKGMSRFVVVGDAATMREALKLTRVPGEVRAISDLSEARFEDGVIDVLDLKNVDLPNLVRGRVSPMCGKASYEYIVTAAKLALAQKVDAVVTSAINKDAMNKAGYHYDGHTSLLAELCEARHVAMMLVAGKLRVVHVSTHISLREALERVRPERIVRVLHLANEGIKQLGVEKPHLAVAGLNPHAGEDQLFGDEEPKYIVPAIEEAKRQGLVVSGPYPPDTIFFRAHEGQFDGAIAMYHDQGHIAVKMLGIWLGVNITLGLPIIRTSVDHGTNFGKAGKGTADPRSLIEAIRLATVMASSKRAASERHAA
jgi:4-hydroxythreonine-4-phosphate dehydrogenase